MVVGQDPERLGCAYGTGRMASGRHGYPLQGGGRAKEGCPKRHERSARSARLGRPWCGGTWTPKSSRIGKRDSPTMRTGPTSAPARAPGSWPPSEMPRQGFSAVQAATRNTSRRRFWADSGPDPPRLAERRGPGTLLVVTGTDSKGRESMAYTPFDRPHRSSEHHSSRDFDLSMGGAARCLDRSGAIGEN